MCKDKNAPKLSVCIVTYNHENFIGECLQSLVDQETNFPFEIIVADDLSKDETRAVVKSFADRYPDKIRAIMQPHNLGPTKNYLCVHEAARGMYIAQMDGDDMALPGKLQAQVDCLDTKPEVSFSVHAVRILGSEKTLGQESHLPEYGSIDDLLRYGTYFVASSVVYRKENEFSHREFSLPGSPELEDYYLHIERASKGYIHLDRRVLGCYRIHPQGMSRNPVYHQVMESTYEAAFDRALELGAPPDLVNSARMKKRMVFSVSRYLFGDVEGYKKKIKINKAEREWASIKHRILHWTRFFPGLVGVYARLRGMGRQIQ